MMTNAVDIRLGRRDKRIGTYAERAQRKRNRQVANQLVKEANWKGDLARSWKDVIDIDDCNLVYGEDK